MGGPMGGPMGGVPGGMPQGGYGGGMPMGGGMPPYNPMGFGGPRGGAGVTCYRCSQPGLYTNARERKKGLDLFVVFSAGHYARDCPTNAMGGMGMPPN